MPCSVDGVPVKCICSGLGIMRGSQKASWHTDVGLWDCVVNGHVAAIFTS